MARSNTLLRLRKSFFVRSWTVTDEELRLLRRQLLDKGAELNDQLTRLLAGQRVDVQTLASGGEPGEMPIERLRRFLDRIDACVRAIRAGSYGRCETCGEPLPFVALREMPWADRCASCTVNQR